MALTDSNTYIEPTAGTSLNASRTQFNNSLRSILTNFRSSSPPAAINITASGDNINVPDGTFFTSTETTALYISDSVSKKSSPIGGNFTRNGIGHRNENGIVAMMANASTYEIGELSTTVSDGALAGNARLYLVTANNRSDADFIDVGIPPTNGSVVNTMIGLSAVTADRVNLKSCGVSTNNLTIKVDIADSNALGKKWAPTADAVGFAAVRISGLGSDDNSAIQFGFGSASANVSLAHQPTLGESKNGLSIVQQDGTYAPIAANVILSSAITGSGTQPVPLMPAGVIVAIAGTVPAGWLECNGQAINRTTYAALYAVTGTTYGAGNGSSTFNVPNFENKVLIGRSSAIALGPGAGTFASGGTITTASASAALSLASTSVATSAKDSSTAAVISGVTAGGHTHTAVVPHAVARYMITT